MTPRQRFDEKLNQIRSEIVRMGNLASDMASRAIEAVQTSDTTLAAAVAAQDDEVDRIEEDTIRSCVQLVMQESPVAGDLRFLTATLGIIGEIEKVADDAVKLARRASRFQGQFPGEFRAPLHEMGRDARQAFASALRLYTAYDPELAQEIIASDERVDKSYSAARQRAIELMKTSPGSTEILVRTIDSFHALEHIADRAVAIAKRMQVHYESAGDASRES
ncbi:MAG TPA: phosphate signaling complex protein PhoU [Fimbriimonadaceae bacterium]|nr:phosphate signaling complex protein PhoU [Fimbriimonadaceae bacterium]